jgi:hypothetical protein
MTDFTLSKLFPAGGPEMAARMSIIFIMIFFYSYVPMPNESRVHVDITLVHLN